MCLASWASPAYYTATLKAERVFGLCNQCGLGSSAQPMTLHLWVLLVGCVTLLEGACVPYKPTLHLEESPYTIPAKVYLELLDDASPPEDKEDASGQSLSQTSTQLMEGDLTTLVTQAILADFRATSVFQSISSQQENPDLILSGTIHRFYGQVSLPSWLLIPGVKLAVQALWGIVQGWEGDGDLELTLARSDGQVLGNYRGQARYQEIAQHDHRFWSAPLYPAHARLNRAFTDALYQIREQMLRDRDLLMAGLRK